MKSFRVTTQPWGDYVLVGAEYYKIEQGALVFRATRWLETEAEHSERLRSYYPNYVAFTARRSEGCPKQVRAFAAGTWREVEEVT